MEMDLFPVVLVVDDDRGQVALVTSFLQKAGFRVVSAQSAEDALAALERAGEASQMISLRRDRSGHAEACRVGRLRPG